MSKIYQLLLFFLLPTGLFAQGETDWWYFGDYAGIHFVDDTLEVVYDSVMETHFGNTTQSDENGNLQFYTNGSVVYNSNHEVMENGNFDGLLSASSAISFKPNLNDNKYFLVNGNSEGFFYQYWYSYIDMDANGGLGSVTDHTFIQDSLMYFVTSTKKSNGVDYWVVFRQAFGNGYLSYSLTEDGFDAENPVYSEAGDVYLNVPQFGRGGISINPQGTLLAFAHEIEWDGNEVLYSGKLELFHFDSESGMVGERIVKLDGTNTHINDIAAQDSVFGAYGLAFSLDGEKLYFTKRGWVFQSNISILDSAAIQQSIVQFNTFLSPYGIAGLQLAKDGRLYIASGSVASLGVIHQPNVAGLDAGFELIAVDLGGQNYSNQDLPNFDPSLFSSGFVVSNRCVNTETSFSLLYDMPYSYVHWDFGDGASSLEWEPTHTYSSIGTYVVYLTTVVGGDTTNKGMEVIIEDAPDVYLGPDSSLFCEGDTLLLDAYHYASYYTWQDSSYKSTFEVTDEGTYYVQVKNICGQSSDTVNFVLDRDNVNLGVDTMICLQEPLYLLADQPSATSWLWQDGSTLPYYEAESTGDYFVFVTTPCQFIYDSISVYTEDCSLQAPNIITPNGDGVNDYFVVNNLDMLDYNWSIEIYNRWGKRVYSASPYQNNWDAGNLSDGVYFYVLHSDETSTSYKGSVSVVRGNK